MKKFSTKLSRYMIGINGNDNLNKFFVFIILFLVIINLFFKLKILSFASYIIFMIYLYRFFSKNTYKRKMENNKFNEKVNMLKRKFLFAKQIVSERKTNKYLKCSVCKTILRVPKGKGKIKVKCTKCGNEFIIKS